MVVTSILITILDKYAHSLLGKALKFSLFQTRNVILLTVT